MLLIFFAVFLLPIAFLWLEKGEMELSRERESTREERKERNEEEEGKKERKE